MRAEINIEKNWNKIKLNGVQNALHGSICSDCFPFGIYRCRQQCRVSSSEYTICDILCCDQLHVDNFMIASSMRKKNGKKKNWNRKCSGFGRFSTPFFGMLKFCNRRWSRINAKYRWIFLVWTSCLMRIMRHLPFKLRKIHAVARWRRLFLFLRWSRSWNRDVDAECVSVSVNEWMHRAAFRAAG